MTDGIVVVDSKYRVVLDKKVRKTAGIAKGERLVTIPFNGGVILASAKGRKFSESLPGLAFREEEHVADKFLQKLVKRDADS